MLILWQGNKKHVGLENVWRQWCIWWENDFSVNGGALKMYDHRFIKSKKKVRERMKAGETDIHDFKEYDDFLVDLCKWIEANYDETISRKDNITILKNRLLKYKAECGRNIQILFKKSGLKEKGYRLQNQTSVNHPLLLGKYVIFHKDQHGMKVCERKNKNTMSQSITLFALLNMLNKVELNCIPEDELKKAKHISAKYGFKKIVNFYQIEEYGFTTLEDSEKIAGTLLDNNVTLKGLSREYILRTFGVGLADKVYPQYKFENRKGTSAKSDYLTGEIATVVLETIKNQGYIFERDVNLDGVIGRQWKKSIQEILDSYGLQRVKLNKELKEKYGIKSNGYPCIIVEAEEEHYCQKQKMD